MSGSAWAASGKPAASGERPAAGRRPRGRPRGGGGGSSLGAGLRGEAVGQTARVVVADDRRVRVAQLVAHPDRQPVLAGAEEEGDPGGRALPEDGQDLVVRDPDGDGDLVDRRDPPLRIAGADEDPYPPLMGV